jgi:hypothetical protein
MLAESDRVNPERRVHYRQAAHAVGMYPFVMRA